MPAFHVIRLLLLPLALIADPSFAQTGTLSGRVVDADNPSQGISPVDVDLLDPVTGTRPVVYTDRTDSGGYYEITNIPVGDYKVIINAFDAASSYVDELFDNIVCDDGTCDRATLGQVISIAEGANTLNASLVNSQPPTNQLSRQQLASLVFLISNRPDFGLFEKVAVDLNPYSSRLLRGLTNEGQEIVVTGTKSSQGVAESISSLSISGNSPASQVLLTLDDQGRPSSIILADGSVRFEYLSNTLVRLTLDADGVVQVVDVSIPAPPPSSSASIATSNASPTLGAECFLSDLFEFETKQGELVFQCDDPYRATPKIAGMLYPRDIEDPFERDIAALPVSIQLTAEQPADNSNVYSYSIEVPTSQPSFEEYDACASRLIGGVTGLAWDYVATVLNKTGAKALEYFQERGVGGADGLSLAVLNDIVSELGTSDALAFLADSLSESSGLEPSDYINADIYFKKKPPSQAYTDSLDVLFSPSLMYSQSGLDVQSPTVLPTLIAGPAPPRLSEIYPVLAFKKEPSGEFVLIDEEADFVVDTGTTLAVRAFDQFFNHSLANTRDKQIETQRYDCAAYRWTVTRNGEPYLNFTGYRQPSGDPGILLEDLPSGNYSATVSVNNNGLAGNFTMDAKWTPKPEDLSAANTDFQDLPLQPLSVDSETIKFQVGFIACSFSNDDTGYRATCSDGGGQTHEEVLLAVGGRPGTFELRIDRRKLIDGFGNFLTADLTFQLGGSGGFTDQSVVLGESSYLEDGVKYEWFGGDLVYGTKSYFALHSNAAGFAIENDELQSLKQISLTEWSDVTDESTYTFTNTDCSFFFSERDQRLYTNGRTVSRTIASGATVDSSDVIFEDSARCPAPVTGSYFGGEGLNLENSVLYRCIKEGKLGDACDLLPLFTD